MKKKSATQGRKEAFERHYQGEKNEQIEEIERMLSGPRDFFKKVNMIANETIEKMIDDKMDLEDLFNLDEEYNAVIVFEIINVLIDRERGHRKENARKGGEAKRARSSISSGSKEALCNAWEAGKYASKKQCAASEYENLGIAYSTALRWLSDCPKKAD